MHKILTQLRFVGIAEGVSFLILLLIAMPLKYVAGMPLAVTIAGSLHGFLFILLMVAMIRAGSEFEWQPKRYIEVVVAAVLPTGTFFLDRKLKEEEKSLSLTENMAP